MRHWYLWRIVGGTPDLGVILLADVSTEVYCLTTEARVCVWVNDLPRVAAPKRGDRKSNLRPLVQGPKHRVTEPTTNI